MKIAPFGVEFRLRRIIASESWIPEIDGLRFVAILAVMLVHTTSEITLRGLHPVVLPLWLSSVLSRGGRGVQLFFVISGFVLARPFYRHYCLGEKPVRLSYYFLRRLTRLEPPYLLSLLIFYLATVAQFPSQKAFYARHTLVSALYLHNFIYPMMSCIPNIVTWSLEIEVQFYLLAPLLALVFCIAHPRLRRTVLVVALGAACVYTRTVSHPYLNLFEFIDCFIAGFVLVDWFDDPRRIKKQTWWWDVIGIVGWVAVFMVADKSSWLSILPLIAVPLYMSTFNSVGLRWLFRRPFLTIIGGMCYSLYLTHLLVMEMAFKIVKRLNFGNGLGTFTAQAVCLLSVCTLAGLVYFVFIERPCMDYKWPSKLMAWIRPKMAGERNSSSNILPS